MTEHTYTITLLQNSFFNNHLCTQEMMGKLPRMMMHDFALLRLTSLSDLIAKIHIKGKALLIQSLHLSAWYCLLLIILKTLFCSNLPFSHYMNKKGFNEERWAWVENILSRGKVGRWCIIQ